MKRVARWNWSNLLAVALGLVLASPIAAQRTPEQKQRAQKHFEEGAALFYEENYEEAIEEFEAGYALVPDPNFLYNETLAHIRLKQWNEALSTAEELRDLPDLPDDFAGSNLGRMRGIEIVRRAHDISADSRELHATREDGAGGEEGIRVERGPEADMPERDPSYVPGEESDVRLGTLGWTGAGIGVVGTGLLISSIFVAVDAEETWKEAEAASRGDDRQRFQTLRSNFEDTQTVGQVLLYTGGGAVMVGATLLIFDLVSDDEGPRVAAGFSASDVWIGVTYDFDVELR